MPYRETKVYFNGGHYIAIPPENFPSKQRKRKKPKPKPTTKPKEKFETAYSESNNYRSENAKSILPISRKPSLKPPNS